MRSPLLLVVLLPLLSGCPNGSDRIFESYGIFYGVSPEGYIAASYRVPWKDRGRVDQTATFKVTATELLAVVNGTVPLQNGLPEDLRKVRTVTIKLIYIDYSPTPKTIEEVFGLIAFPVEDLAQVAKNGPTESMKITDRNVWKEAVTTIAARENKKLMAAPE